MPHIKQSVYSILNTTYTKSPIPYVGISRNCAPPIKTIRSSHTHMQHVYYTKLSECAIPHVYIYMMETCFILNILCVFYRSLRRISTTLCVCVYKSASIPHQFSTTLFSLHSYYVGTFNSAKDPHHILSYILVCMYISIYNVYIYYYQVFVFSNFLVDFRSRRRGGYAMSSCSNVHLFFSFFF